ncbi:hypothetical protein IJI28_01685 [Candidatus Saccharibacteria bacterium]|nr:hypothetical protein [Candidatus Saccharibacteria bacterium]
MRSIRTYAFLYVALFAVMFNGVLLCLFAFADDSAVTVTTITVPVACTLRGTGTAHSATLSPNTYSGANGSEYEDGIGKTTLTAICNDDNGFSIYAIGYTGNSYISENHTKLIGNDLGGIISTKVYESGDSVSNWSMKLTKVTYVTESYNPHNLTLTTGYDSWHVIPDTYTKVAQYKANTGSSTTDTTLGVKLETTYAAFIASNQPADTYVGQVKYTMVHPYNEEALQPQITESGCIRYYKNGGNVEGTMGCQPVSASATNVTLLASNYSRQGYGFAGWSDVYDYEVNSNAHFYGPNEEISFEAGTYSGSNPGLSLYAVWIKSQGYLQDSAKVAALCGAGQDSLDSVVFSVDPNNQDDWSITAGLSSVTALTDTRDNETYAVAKLSDGNCWMIENLRLSNKHQENGVTVPTVLTLANTNNPLNDGVNVTLKHNYTDTETYSTLSASSDVIYNETTAPEGWCNTISAECIDQSRIRTDNTTDRASNPTDNFYTNLYGYGNYYNWYSATAGRGTYSKLNSSTEGDLCPYGWHLPTGTGSGEFGLLSNSLGGPKNANNVAVTMINGSTTPTNTVMLQRLRHFPNNIVYSGSWSVDNSTTIGFRGSSGAYWSSTATTSNNGIAYYFDYLGSAVYPGTRGYRNKFAAMTVRCITSGM